LPIGDPALVARIGDPAYKALKLGEVEDFPFVDPPPSRAIADGYQLLAELNAVDEQRRLTPIGSQLAKLPVDPRVARMIVAARDEACLAEILIIASGLAVPDPRDRPMDKQELADTAHAQFQDERSSSSGLARPSMKRSSIRSPIKLAGVPVYFCRTWAVRVARPAWTTARAGVGDGLASNARRPPATRSTRVAGRAPRQHRLRPRAWRISARVALFAIFPGRRASMARLG
jgi:HrpA-like RNA helicase